MIKEAIILAGGLGTRLRSAVPDLPKPMAPVGNRPFLEFVMDHWIAQGIERFILSVGYRRDAIQSHFGQIYRGAEVIYAVEAEPRGTGGGLAIAHRLLNSAGPVVIANGDTYFEVDLPTMVDFHRGHGAELTMALTLVNENTRYGGIELDRRERVRQFGGTGVGNQVNGGVYLAERSLLRSSTLLPADTRLSLENDFLPRALQTGRGLFGFRAAGTFVDIGIPDDYRQFIDSKTKSSDN